MKVQHKVWGMRSYKLVESCRLKRMGIRPGVPMCLVEDRRGSSDESFSFFKDEGSSGKVQPFTRIIEWN